MHSWLGLARPSGATATASPPQMSLAPLSPKRRHRRRTSSVGRPSVVPSQPSIGRIANRLPTRPAAPSARGWARAPSGSTDSSTGRSTPSWARRLVNAAWSASRRTCTSPRGSGIVRSSHMPRPVPGRTAAPVPPEPAWSLPPNRPGPSYRTGRAPSYRTGRVPPYRTGRAGGGCGDQLPARLRWLTEPSSRTGRASGGYGDQLPGRFVGVVRVVVARGLGPGRRLSGCSV